MNGHSVSAFRKEVCQLWWKVLKRRSHKHRLPWDRMKRFADKWLPSPVSVILILPSESALLPEARTVCGRAARTGLCGGRRATGVPTATTPRPDRLFLSFGS